jgi:hypothetical protein
MVRPASSNRHLRVAPYLTLAACLVLAQGPLVSSAGAQDAAAPKVEAAPAEPDIDPYDGGPIFDALFGKAETQCYAMTRDAAYLKAHKRAKVVSLRLDRMKTYQDGAKREDALPNILSIEVRFRDRPKKLYLSSTNCMRSDGDTTNCHSESCDGGHFRIAQKGENLEISFGGKDGYFVFQGCDEGEYRSMTWKDTDEGTILLPLIAGGQCKTHFKP